jgi:segregation and condensation protein A
MDEEPVEILVGMAERGEIDPWNVDIVEVTDRFLSELERLKALDLRISGRTLFYAALLLRMKSEYLQEAEETGEFFLEGEEGFGDGFEFEETFEAEELTEPIARLEREIQRRIGRKKLRTRPVTLYELILELKTAEKEERRRHRKRRAFPPMLVQAEDLMDLMHEESYEDATISVLLCFEQVEKAEDCITLLRLSEEMGKIPRDVYIPLLFLMQEGKLMISQEEFFGEITVSKG